MQVTDSFLYEKEKDGAVILRCFLRDGKVEVPDTLDGLPVTALAPYAFSAQADSLVFPSDPQQTDGTQQSGIPAGGQKPPGRAAGRDMTSPAVLCGEALCGEALTEIVLPATLSRVGKYCFYNCENLKSFSYANPRIDWGSGAFAGCHQIRSILAPEDALAGGSLQHFLSEISEELTVSAGPARLVFPEFYEEGVENTPARILQTQVHGTGILYRNCFTNGKFDFAQYDALFPYALAQESKELLSALVIGRLRFPYALTEDAKARYLAYAKEHLLTLGETFLSGEDTEGLSWFLNTFSPEREVLDTLGSKAAAQKEAQLVGILMEYRHQESHPMTGRKRLIL